MKHKNLFIFISSFTLLLAQDSWASTSFEYFWNQAFKRLQFREPQSFTPIEIKFGRLSYGGNQYWGQGLFEYDLNSDFALLDSTENTFNMMGPNQNRQLFFIEVDLLKVNLLNYIYYQNYIDLQFGFGLNNIFHAKSINLPDHWIKTLPNNESLGEYSFKPNIYNVNYNITASYQLANYFISYLRYNLGYSFGSMYESIGGNKYLNATGVSEGVSAGIKYVVNPKGLAFNFTYGFDFRFQRITLLDMYDPNQISNLNGIDLYSKGILFSISTTFGGRASNADIAYRKMIKEDYIEASLGFEDYLVNYPKSNKAQLAKKMLDFCNQNIPYQQFDTALYYFEKQDLEIATKWVKMASENADSSLLSEIKLYKQNLATSIIEDAKKSSNIEDMMKSYNISYQLAPNYFFVKKELANFYIIRGDAQITKKNYDLAYDYYNKAIEILPNMKRDVSQRFSKLIEGFVNDAKIAYENSEYIFAKYCLERVIQINPSYIKEVSDLLSDINEKIQIDERKFTTQKIREFISSKTEQRKERLDHELELGMNKDEVLELIDEPDYKDETLRGNTLFEMWTYSNKSNIKRLIFENNFLIKVE